jgi:alpha-tubulin suppressor-like RCC1 family protein
VLGIPRVVAVRAGGSHTIFLTDDGRLFVVGRASSGRLGLGASAEALGRLTKPVELEIGGHRKYAIAGVACGGSHSLVLTREVVD